MYIFPLFLPFFNYLGKVNFRVFRFSSESRGAFTTPFSVMIPPVIRSAGVTSKAGFQQQIPVVNIEKLIIEYVVGGSNWLESLHQNSYLFFSDICWQIIFDSLISIICSIRSHVPVLTQNSKDNWKKSSKVHLFWEGHKICAICLMALTFT